MRDARWNSPKPRPRLDSRSYRPRAKRVRRDDVDRDTLEERPVQPSSRLDADHGSAWRLGGGRTPGGRCVTILGRALSKRYRGSFAGGDVFETRSSRNLEA